MNSSGVLGRLAYTQALRPGVQFALGILVDTKHLGKYLGSRLAPKHLLTVFATISGHTTEPAKPAHSVGLSLKVHRVNLVVNGVSD